MQKANKKSGFPVAVLDVTSRDGPCSPEYLLCFHEMGIFVDGYGQRSREDCILWSRVPFTVGKLKFEFHVSIHHSFFEIKNLTEARLRVRKKKDGREENQGITLKNHQSEKY